ncbi:MAG TPA: class 1 fructose-bisphosphatase [Candidatus Nanopelagicales bacterium]
MRDDPGTGGPHTLAAALRHWSAGDPGRTALADVIAASAEAGAQLAELIATSPLDAVRTSTGSAAGHRPGALDVQAEQLFVAAMSGCEVAAVGSQETLAARGPAQGGGPVVALCPIVGSSDVESNAPMGSIFAVLPPAGPLDDPRGALLQPGRSQLAAGLIVYGPSTTMALTWGDGTGSYALDPSSREFVRTRERLELPADAQEYSIDASNARHWGPGITAYVNDLVNGSLGVRERDFTMRWLASLAAEAYRILLRGGIFLSPADDRPGNRHGHVRLVFEANPVAFLCEQAGGTATDGVQPILDLRPAAPDQRTPLVFGSRNKVDRVRRYLMDPRTTHPESPLFSQRGLFRS